MPAEALEFEFGPTTDVTLQWATYFDGSILAEPILEGLEWGDNGLELRAALVRGMRFKVEGSSDLRTWDDETSLQQALDSEVVMPVDATPDRRFYRVVQQGDPQ